MSKHTPGPWRVSEWVQNGEWIADSLDRWIAWAVHAPGLTVEETEANAVLIAAAPELAAAGLALYEWHTNPDAPDDCWSLLRAALVKAGVMED